MKNYKEDVFMNKLGETKIGNFDGVVVTPAEKRVIALAWLIACVILFLMERG